MVWVSFAIHFVLNLFLVFFPLFESATLDLWGFTLVVSQVSLIALWCVHGPAKLHVRILSSVAVLLYCWWMLKHLLTNLTDEEVFVWGICLWAQFLTVAALLLAHRVWHRRAEPFHFDIQSLLLCTLLIAAGFAVLNFGCRYYKLTLDDFFSEMVVVVDVAIAFMVISAIIGFITWTWKRTSILVTATLLGTFLTWLISLTINPVLEWSFTSTYLSSDECFTLSVGSYWIVTGTLLVVHLPFRVTDSMTDECRVLHVKQ